MVRSRIEVINDETGEVEKVFDAEGSFVFFGGVFNNITEVTGDFYVPEEHEYNNAGEIGYSMAEGDSNADEMRIIVERLVKIAVERYPVIGETIFQDEIEYFALLDSLEDVPVDDFPN